MVMLSACPSRTIDAGYMASNFAPFQYNGSRGPGTLEIITLKAWRFGIKPEAIFKPAAPYINAL